MAHGAWGGRAGRREGFRHGPGWQQPHIFQSRPRPTPPPSPAPLLGPDAVLSLYLLNPLSILSCASGCTSPLEALAVVGAVAAGVGGDLPAAALALACGAYVGLHPALLLVRPGGGGARGKGGGCGGERRCRGPWRAARGRAPAPRTPFPSHAHTLMCVHS